MHGRISSYAGNSLIWQKSNNKQRGESKKMTKQDERMSNFIQEVISNKGEKEFRIGDFYVDNHYYMEAHYEGEGGDVVVPEEIGKALLDFSKNVPITSLVLPGTMKTVYEFPIKKKASLKKLVLKEGVEEIFATNFMKGFANLKEVELPNSLIRLEKGAFQKTPWFNDHVEKEGGVHYLGRFVVDSDENVEEANIRDGAIMICANAFKDRHLLKSVTFPSSLREIASLAFNGCESLEKIHIPEKVNSIGESAFANCRKLKEIKVMANGKYIDPYAFIDKEGFSLPTRAYFPVELFRENDGSAKDYYALCYLTDKNRYTPDIQAEYEEYIKKRKRYLLPEIISRNRADLLASASNLLIDSKNIEQLISNAQETNRVELVAVLLEWKNQNILSKGKKEAIKDPYNTADMKRVWSFKKLEDGTLELTSYKGKEVEIEVPPRIGKAAVTVIGENCFSPFKDDTLVYMKPIDRVMYLNKIKSITIPEGVVKIKKAAFGGCEQLDTIVLPKSLVEIENVAFKRCLSLIEITIPENVKIISNNLFLENSALTRISLPTKLTKIGYQAFDGCTNLKEIHIPACVTEIDQYAIGYRSRKRISDVIIYGKPGSQAELYAKENNIDFQEE